MCIRDSYPGSQGKLLSISIAAHVFLSIGAYALLSLAVGQSVLLSIQERYLHEHNFNTFVDKLPALQTMEDFLYQTLKMGFLLLTLSLISGYLYITDFFHSATGIQDDPISHGLDWFCWHLVCPHGFWNQR